MTDAVQVRIMRLPHAADLPLPAYQSAHAAGRQRRQRAAVDCTAVQAVAAALLTSGMASTGTASGPRPRLQSSKNSAHC